MIFSSTSFLLLFLPLLLGGYFITPPKHRNKVLCIASILFYLCNDPMMFAPLCFLILLTYGCIKYRSNKNHLWISIGFLLFLMIYFKYYGWLLTTLGIGNPKLVFNPLGYSFILFSMLSAVIDFHRDDTLKPKFVIYFNYILFFPKIFMGPLMRYADFEQQWNDHPTSSKQLVEGSRFLLKGCVMKVILANTFATIFSLCSDSTSMLAAWMMLVAYGLQLYYDFYGYTCMAQGISKFLGFTLPENFNHPYIATSLQNFWTRWHISLSTWFKDYLYIPLGGNRHGKKHTMRNLMIVWIATGLWHGSSLPYLLWGLYHGSLLLVERFVLKDLLNKIPLWFRRTFTFILVLIGWITFFQPTIKDCGVFFIQLLNMTQICDVTSISILSQYVSFFIVGLLAMTYLPSHLSKWIQKQCGTTFVCVEVVVSLSMWLIIFAYLMADSYQAFLYFQF